MKLKSIVNPKNLFIFPNKAHNNTNKAMVTLQKNFRFKLAFPISSVSFSAFVIVKVCRECFYSDCLYYTFQCNPCKERRLSQSLCRS